MANLDQLGLPNGSTYNFKDNTQERSDHRHYGSDTIPLVHKLYESTSYYATSAGSYDTSSWYFMSVKPDEWYKPWKVKFKVHSYCPGYANVDSYTWATLSGRADGLIYANWNEHYDNAHYYTVVYPLKKAGFDAGYGHAVGICIIYSAGYTTAAYYRTFEIDYYECENCTVTILDTPVKWANWTGTGTTNYGSLGAFDAVNRGLRETGDDNTVTENRIGNFAGKTGVQGVWAGSLFMEDANGTYQNICTASDGTATASNRTTATTKIPNSNGFKVLGTIWYCNTNYNANTNISGGSVVYSAISAFDSRYAFNTTLTANSLTPYKEVYLVGTINSNGLFYLDNPWWTQTPTDPTKVYVLVGACFDSTTSNCRVTLYEQNKWYRYSGSNLIEIANDARTVNGHTVDKDVPSNAVFTDTTYSLGRNGESVTLTPTGGTAQSVTLSSLINGLSTGASELTANDYVITQYVGGGTTTTSYHRRPANKVINSTLVKAALGTGSDTTKYLRNDGTWQVPPNDNTDIKVRQTLNTENNNYPLLMSYALTSTATANIDNVSYRNSSIYANPAKGSIVATTARTGDTYYGISCGKTTSTVTESILYTGIQWINSTHMPVVHFRGYAFSTSAVVDLQVGFYIYNNNIGWCGVSNCGAWAPEIYAFKYTKSSVNYVAIGLKGSIGYLLIQADISDGLNKFGKISTNPSDWTWTFTSTATIPTPDSGVTCIKATYTADILKDTTYTLGTSGNNVTLTPTGGTAQSITVPYATSSGTADQTKAHNITIQTGSSAQQKITLQTLMTWLITTKGYIPSGVHCYRVIETSWVYASNDILQLSAHDTNYELQLAGVIIEFFGNATSYNAGVFRLRIHSSPTTSFTPSSGYTIFPTSHIAEYTCNGSGYSPTWKVITDKSDDILGNAATATTATKLGSSTVGGTTTPIYLNAGVPTALSYTIAKSVPSTAVFTDTTYTFANGTNGFTVTPSGGTAQTVTVTPSITNNVTGSGTSGYIAKWNGANTITNGPAFGSTTTTYLNNAGNWATPPDTKNTAGSTDTSSKIFLIGATSQAANPQTYSDNEVYATSGILTTKSVQIGGGSCTLQYNSTTASCDFVFA